MNWSLGAKKLPRALLFGSLRYLQYLLRTSHLSSFPNPDEHRECQVSWQFTCTYSD